MQLTTWKPFREMDDFFRRTAEGLSIGSLTLFDKDGHNISEWSPTADIIESKKEFVVKAELPDVAKEDIHVDVSGGKLTIQGERKHDKEEEDEKYHRVESFYGRFTRSFNLPHNIDEAGISANFKRGVLRIRIPKSEQSPAQPSVEIEIK